MSVQLVLKNSSVQDKEATAAQLAVGELALNYHSSGPFLQCEDSAGNIWRLGGVVIASTAPSSPSKGAWWLDSDDDHLYFYDGSSWIEIQTGEIVPGDITEGTARQLLQTNAAGNGTEWTSNIDVPGTLDVTGVATFDNNVVITGNLTVNGTTTTIDTTTLVVEDKNIELGVVGTPTDTTADGGGITVKGATDKTLTWVNSTGAWTSNQPLDVNGEVECDGIANGTSSVSVAASGDITVTRAGSTKLTANSGGLFVNGNVALGDGHKAVFGASDDLQIFHDGTQSFIHDAGTGSLVIKADELFIQNAAGTENKAYFQSNAHSALYYDNSQKLATTSGGINVTGTVQANRIDAVNTGGPMLILKDSDSSGNSATMYLEGQDSLGAQKWYVGDTNTNGDIRIRNTQSGSLVLGTNNADYAIIDPTGNFIPDANNSYDLGTTSKQWRNAYFDGTVNCDGLVVDGSVNINAQTSQIILKDTNSTGSGATGNIVFQDSAGTNKWRVGDNSTGNETLELRNFANGSVKLSLNNGGKEIDFTTDGHWVPGDNNAQDLGTSGNQWRNGYFDGTVYCDGLVSDGDVTIQSGTGLLTIKDTDHDGIQAVQRIIGADSSNNTDWYVGQVGTGNNYLYVSNNNSAPLIFRTASTERAYFQDTGHFVPWTSNTYDIGGTSNQWRDAFFDGTVYTDLLEVDNQAGFQGKVYGAFRTATASSFNLATGNFWTFGAIAVPNPSNQTTGISGVLVVTAAPTSFASNWKFPGGSYTAPTAFPAVAPFFIQSAGTSILVGSWTEGIA